MSILTIFKNLFNKSPKPTVGTAVKLVTERGNGVYIWDGNLYDSDIIRSCIRPFAVACGKAVPKHIRGHGDELVTNPEPYMRFLLEEPNPYMSMQQLIEKLARQRELNNNAFALIVRDPDDIPYGIYPINAANAEAIYDNAGNLYLRFLMLNGKIYTFPYSDIIHLRQDFGCNDIFGTPPGEALTSMMNVLGNIDNSIVAAIKNGALIRWLLVYNSALRPEDLKKNAQDFADAFLLSEASGSGVAAVDSKAEAKQIMPTDYVPNAAVTDRTIARLYGYFGTNADIIQSRYTEDQWNAYYESKIEPFLIDFANELTRKIFSRRERGLENRIYCENSNLAYASMNTKLKLSGMVDRGAMTPNEWREIMNMPSLPGGDLPIRRLDTAAIDDSEPGRPKEKPEDEEKTSENKESAGDNK